MSSRVISAVLTLRDKDFTKNINRASENADDFSRRVAYIGNGIKRFGNTATQTFKNIATGIGGISLVGLSAGVTALTTGVASSVLEMDKSFARMSAKTGATGEELKALQDVAKNVFTDGFGESMTEVVENVGTLSSMFDDLNKKQLTETAKGVSTIAELFEQDFKEVGKTISTMTKTFDDLSESQALDLLTTAFQETGDMSGDLLDTFNEYSTQFKALGYDAEGFTATLISGAKAGVFNFDKLADAAKESFLKLGEGSNDTIAALQLMGLDADKVMSDIAQGGDTANQAFMAVSTAIGTIEDPAKRNQAAIAAFGTPLEDLGPQFQTFFSNVNKDLGNFEGATAKAADAMHDNFSDRMTSAWRDLKIGITDMVSSGEGKEFLDSLATGAENLVPKIQDIIGEALEFGNTIRDNWEPIKNTVLGIGTAVGTFAVIMGGLKTISFITTLINGFRTAMTLATAGQWAMNTAMLASPLTWVAVGIAAVVAAGVLLYKNWDTVKAKADELWGKTKEVFGNIFDWASEKISPVTEFFQGLVDKFNNFKDAITNFEMPEWVSSIGDTVSSATSKVKNMLPSFDVGTNNVAHDMTANIHKGEMIIPARQAERLRQQGVTIDNIDKVKGSSNGKNSTVTTTVTNSPSNTKNEVNVNIYPTGTTAAQVINEIVPQLKLVLANL